MNGINTLLATDRPFLTDGGFETSLFFLDGFDAPEFAAIVLLDDPAARRAMWRYFDGFLGMAEKAETGFVLDTNTWRGCTRWADKLGVTGDKLLSLSADAVAFAAEIRDAWRARVSPVLVNGVVGPMGDGYVARETYNADDARAAHAPQIRTLAENGVDMIAAITMTNVAEAVGIIRCAVDHATPVTASFTVETDGRLPTGETLAEAIRATDDATDAAAAYYMVNCAHPDHFSGVLTDGGDWLNRIGGVRANASRLSHAELDAAESLDDGDPEEFGQLHVDLARHLPNLRVVGGCCGTDHRHVGCVSKHLHSKAAA